MNQNVRRTPNGKQTATNKPNYISNEYHNHTEEGGKGNRQT